jgi:hypothetical protein
VVVFKDATETITNIRDSIGEMAQTLLQRCDYVRMTPQDLKMYVGALETANKILITNTLFLKQHVDASTMSDQELADLAHAMLPNDLRTITVESENATDVRCVL